MAIKQLFAAATRLFTSDGTSVESDELKEPQTAQLTSLHHEFQGHPSRGLTPSKLASIMDRAEHGDITAQFELYEDMEEKDGHIMAEMGKRRRAVTGLNWTLTPPANPTTKEKENTAQLAELMQGLDDFEDVLFDTTDAIGKGFCCQELEWHRTDGLWLPKTIQHRPQSWFQIVRGFEQKIHLRGPANGQPLQPFGWIVHTHKAKSGHLERSALFRVLLWPYLFKNYSVGDLAEFLEIYGIPLRLGKYPTGATEKEKLTLMRALAQIGHNAAGIIPRGMELEFHPAADGDPAAFKLMIEWCEKTQSKAILGGTLTSQADGASSTNALGNVHNEVRKELTVSDSKQIAKTISRDLIYPIAALNGLAVNFTRCPRLKFDTNEPEDMKAMSAALPVFVDMGMRIGRQWAQERAGIPEPDEDEEVLMRSVKPAAANLGARAALNQQIPGKADVPVPQQMMEQARALVEPATNKWIDRIRELTNSVSTLEELQEALLNIADELTLDEYAEAFATITAAAQLAGRNEIVEAQ